MLVSTRNESKKSFTDAIFSPLCPSGGLYCFEKLEKINEDLSGLNYKQMALKIISHLLPELSQKTIEISLEAYDEFDNKSCPINIQKINENLYINELFLGPTRAFKDMALCPFARLFNLLKNPQKNYLIMCATSGDTGPATLNAFANLPNIKVVCIYPKGKTSVLQEKQMQSQNATNRKVIAINGDFDDAQKSLKNLLANKEFNDTLKEKNYILSAANSVNIGRILYQIIYHYYAAIKITNQTQNAIKSVNIIIPSGNFGNALACFYAKKLGAPINKIKIISNENNILTEFFKTGIYDLNNKTLKLTNSPAMDILLSSNIERLLFYFFGAKRTNELYENLKNHKKFILNQEELKMLQDDFDADFCTDTQTLKNIKDFSQTHIIDPHTATALIGLNDEPSVICSTAKWVKFIPSMAKALWDENGDELSDFSKISIVFNQKKDEKIQKLLENSYENDKTLNPEQIKENILEWL